MQGPRGRLDQIFPARKASSHSLESTPPTKLDRSPSGKKREKSIETSPHKKASLESFLVRGRSNENPSRSNENACSGLAEKKNKSSEHVGESNLAKSENPPERNKGTNATDSWLQRCGTGVSKFVKKSLLDTELGNVGQSQPYSTRALDGPHEQTAHCDNLSDSPQTAVADDLQPAKDGQEKDEKDVQLTQFANEFLSICVSGYAKMMLPTSKPTGSSEAVNKKRTRMDIGVDDYGENKKQKIDDNLEEDFISCTQFPHVTDITGNAVSKIEHQQGIFISEKTERLPTSSRECGIRSGLASGQVVDNDLPPTEKPNGTTNVVLGGDNIEREKPQIGANAVGLSKTLVACDKYLHVFPSKGTVSGRSAENGLLQFVTREGSSLPPVFKSPEDRRQRKLQASSRTPNSRSKSRSKVDEGELCFTPYLGSSKKSMSRSSSSAKSSGWQYQRSMFSPGDAFWDEAIEAVDGLLVSKLDESPLKQSSLGKSKLSGTVTDEIVDVGPKNPDNQAEVVKAVGTMEKEVVENLDLCVRTDGEEGPAPMSGVKLGDNISAQKEVFVGGLSEVDSSPLPVRRFSFTCQNSPPKRSICNVSDDVVQQSHSVSQCPPVTLTRKPPVSIDIGATYQAEEVVDIDATVITAEMKEDGLVPAFDPTVIKAAPPAPCTVAEPSINVMYHTKIESPGGLSGRPELAVSAAGLPESGKEDDLNRASSLKQINVELSDWLPLEICAIYGKKGLTKLYPWQGECLQLDGVLEGRSLVYCASTSAGKSLVAEVLMIRRILVTGKKALLVLPYVALCSEKLDWDKVGILQADHLDAVLEPLGKRVRGFYGAQGSGSLPRDTSVAVCTIEKANSLVNKLLEEGRLSELAIIVIDELHMVGDRDRGYLLELLLTKLRYAAGGGESAAPDSSSKQSLSSRSSWNTDLQIVGMSATMPNVSDVAAWLQAALYQTEFRPVPLEEFMKIGHTIYNKKMEVVRSIRKGADLGGKDPDHVVELCHEVVSEGHSVLLFCSSRKGCETSARHIAKFLPPFSILERKNASGPVDGNAAVEELRRCPAGLDAVLADTLPAGVAYHHAGLTVEEREVVEACFKSGVVRVLVATSTLAAGVNLPARRVIFRQPKIGRDFIDATRYRQMAGRAGRAGIDVKGESILICKPEEAKRMEGIMKQDCKALQSCLADDKNGMMRALLEVVAGGVVQSTIDVQRYVRCTLLNATQPFEEVVRAAQDSLRWLCQQHLLEWDSSSRLYTTTPLGRAAFSSSLTPEESLVVYEDLAKAREGFVLASDLHLLYEVTPTYVDLEPDWSVYYKCFMELSSIDQAVGNRVGVSEPFLMRMAHGAPVVQQRTGVRPRGGKVSKGKNSPPGQKSKWNSPNGAQPSVDQMLRVCKRFYVALMLSKLVQEVSLVEVCETFKVPRGTVQGLQESAGRFAGMVAAFCERLGWSDMEGLVSKFQKRVSFGVKSEIVDLTEIPFVKAARARALFKAGLRSIQAIAEATLLELVKALYGTSWAGQGEISNRGQHWMQMGVARKIKNGARRIALDRAEEARVAAFAAYEALGVKVPIGLATTIVPATDDEAAEASAYTSTNLVEGPNMNDVTRLTEVPLRFHQSEPTGSITANQCTSNEPGSKESESVQNQGGPKNDASKEANILQQDMGSGRLSGCPQPEPLKSEVAISDKGSLFAGSLVLEEKNAVDIVVADVVKEPTRGPVDVDNLLGGFEAFLTQWQSVDEFAFDLFHKSQSNGTLPEIFQIVGIAVCWKNSPVYYVNFLALHKFPSEGPCDPIHANLTTPSGETATSVTDDTWNATQTRWRKVGDMLLKSGARKIAWDIKSQLHALKSPGLFVPSLKQAGKVNGVSDLKARELQLSPLPPLKVVEPVVDIRVAAWLLWPDEESSQTISLEQEVRKRLPGEIAAAANRAGRWMNQMGCVAHNGCCRRTAHVWALHLALWKLLVSEGLHQPLLQLEMPLVKVLTDMETWGLGVDMNACRKAQSLLHSKLRALEVRAEQLAGTNFSLTVPAEVAHVLYRHLKLPVPPGCKGKQHPSTDKHALDALRDQHPIADVIKEHRSLSKLLHSTFGSIITWAKSPESCAVFKEGSKREDVYCISGKWLQTSTATGRLSMEDPNLQCVEHPISFANESGSISDNGTENACQMVEVNARQVFVPTQEGWVLMSADYSQIEVRLMAHFSGDPSLVCLLSKPTGDLFRLLAAEWTGLPDSEVSEKQRERTKRLVYGILYGMGVNTLSEHLQCPLREAQEMLERFKAKFPVVSTWLIQAVNSCRQKGYIKTLSGRKRYLDKINHGKWGEQAKAERQAVNSICQGSAADLIKLAMIKVHDAISTSAVAKEQSSHQKNGYLNVQGSCRLLLQIHDELVLEVDKSLVKDVANTLRTCMEGAATLRVPLRAKLEVGMSWGSLQPYTDDLPNTSSA